jgi:hypothetical protein
MEISLNDFGLRDLGELHRPIGNEILHEQFSHYEMLARVSLARTHDVFAPFHEERVSPGIECPRQLNRRKRTSRG